jgi:hypothetical protein
MPPGQIRAPGRSGRIAQFWTTSTCSRPTTSETDPESFIPRGPFERPGGDVTTQGDPGVRLTAREPDGMSVRVDLSGLLQPLQLQ